MAEFDLPKSIAKVHHYTVGSMSEKSLPVSHLFFTPKDRWVQIRLGKPEGFNEQELLRELRSQGVEAKIEYNRNEEKFDKLIKEKTGIKPAEKTIWVYHPEQPGEKPAMSIEGPLFRDNLIKIVQALARKGFEPRVFHSTRTELSIWHPTPGQWVWAKITQIFRS